MPFDVFAAAAHLLEASGAHQYIVAPFEAKSAKDVDGRYTDPTREPKRSDIEKWIEIGVKWSGNQLARGLAQPKWTELLKYEGRSLVENPSYGEPPPEWWAVAHALLVIADEACESIGYMGVKEALAAHKWANMLSASLFDEVTKREVIVCADRPNDSEGHLSRHVALDSMSRAAREVVRVLPKGRTTDLGCNMRTLSHNLALLPAHGRANAYWHRPERSNEADTSQSLNLLAIPFPFAVPPGCFQGYESKPGPNGERWGRFKIHQRWLSPDKTPMSSPASREAFAAFVGALIEKAEGDGTQINGILLPEYALDWATYDLMVRTVRDGWPGVEIIVSGLSEDCRDRPGNTVASTVMVNNILERRRQALTHSRRKHHRWRIDGPQIRSYQLQAELDEEVTWWEHLDVEERVLHIDLLREGSTFTAVVCEDLARVEPGLSLLRSLGANLVFALLMDGPQAERRWPGTYATGLADDPGSSVFSFTSMGLVRRSNESYMAGGGAREPTRNLVGLWKNRAEGGAERAKTGNDRKDKLYEDGRRLGKTIEIDLETGHGLVVQLEAAAAQEITIDGRRNDDTKAWYLSDYRAISLDNAAIDANNWNWILGR